MHWIFIFLAGLLGLLASVAVWTYRAMRWGATRDEVTAGGTADAWFDGVPGSRFRIVRAISIEAPPETVWPWLAQNGRGAGWSSYERLDNGGRASARHIVSWIPEPSVGDAAGVGYLRYLEPGRELIWWAPDDPFLGARTWSAWTYQVAPEGDASRLLFRVDVAAAGAMSIFVALFLPLIDSIMSIRQLRNLKERAERYGTRADDPENPETGERDQYQLYHVIYASGEEAGVPGVEGAMKARKWAEDAGVV